MISLINTKSVMLLKKFCCMDIKCLSLKSVFVIMEKYHTLSQYSSTVYIGIAMVYIPIENRI